jgi:hypothetical protein
VIRNHPDTNLFPRSGISTAFRDLGVLARRFLPEIKLLVPLGKREGHDFSRAARLCIRNGFSR